MPQDSPITDLVAEMNRINNTLAATTRALQKAQLKALEIEAAQLRLGRLETEMQILKRYIDTIIALQQSQGREPKVDELRQQLSTKQKELESFATEYHLELSKPKLWWQFWK